MFADIHLNANALAQYGLPDVAYPVPTGHIDAALADGILPFAAMLYGLQQRGCSGDADWKQSEPAMARLAELLAPIDDRAVVTATGDDWWLELGPVDLSQTIVTIQRDGCLVVAISRTSNGRLRIRSVPAAGFQERGVLDQSWPKPASAVRRLHAGKQLGVRARQLCR
jgi:hypothetical protein